MEEIVVLLAFMEMMRRQDHAEHWNFSLQPNLHHAVNDGSCHEIMPVNAAVHHESRTDDSGVFSSLGQGFGMKGIS